MVKVLENSNSELLNNLLIQYSKIDFYDYCNLQTLSPDLARIEINLESGSLLAFVQICKQIKYKSNLSASRSFNSQYLEISKVNILESTIIAAGDALDVSGFRLAAAHAEKLYLKQKNVC